MSLWEREEVQEVPSCRERINRSIPIKFEGVGILRGRKRLEKKIC